MYSFIFIYIFIFFIFFAAAPPSSPAAVIIVTVLNVFCVLLVLFVLLKSGLPAHKMFFLFVYFAWLVELIVFAMLLLYCLFVLI